MVKRVSQRISVAFGFGGGAANGAQAELVEQSGQVSLAAFRVGQICQGRFTEDGVWYAAKILQHDPASGHYLVEYTEYGNQEWLPVSSLK
jgi:hypothetical protein